MKSKQRALCPGSGQTPVISNGSRCLRCAQCARIFESVHHKTPRHYLPVLTVPMREEIMKSKYDSKYFVEVEAEFPARPGYAQPSRAFIVARISDGQFVDYPSELGHWTEATNLGELLRDGFSLFRARERDGDES